MPTPSMMHGQSPYRSADPLGALVATYRVAVGQQFIRLVLGGFAALVAMDCVVLGVEGPPNRAQLDPMLITIFGLVAMIFAYLAYYAFAHYARDRRMRVEVREFGLRQGDDASFREVRWDEITTVWATIWSTPRSAPSEAYVHSLGLLGDGHLDLPRALSRGYELGRHVGEQTFERLLATARATLAEGRPVWFGACTLEADALDLQGTRVRFRDIDTVKLYSRWLEVTKRRGGRALIPTEQVSNLHVLLALCDEALGRTEAKSA